MLLAIDTSTRYAGIALADEDQIVASHTWHSGFNHTAELMPAVIRLLQERGISVQELEAVAVALGPGGFSALRVGISVTKGLATAASIPIVGVGSLDLEAFPFVGSGMPVCALLESGRAEAASALFAADGQRLRDNQVSTVDELLEEIQQTTIFCGEGLARWTLSIQSGLASKAVICSTPPAVRVWSLIAMARQRLNAGQIDNLATLQPQYLKMPSIGLPKQRDWVAQEPSNGVGRERA